MLANTAESQPGAADSQAPAAAEPAVVAPNTQGDSATAGSSEHNLPRDEDLAFRELARLWGVTLAAGDACAAARAERLHCYRGNQGIAEIRQLERPAVLTLHDAEGKPYFAILTGLTNASATLHIGEDRHTVSLLELGRRFPGQFATFWRVQTEQRDTLTSGERGADVAWLAQQLARLNGSKGEARNSDAGQSANQTFDQKLVVAVREFQRAQGLAADGIVGPRTLMHLNSAIGVDEPRLQNSLPAATAALGK